MFQRCRFVSSTRFRSAFDDPRIIEKIPGVINIHGQRAAVLICYEQLLTWPVLLSMAQHPTILIVVANDYWASRTPIPAVQRVALTAWARLFALPKLMAVNT